MSKVIPFSRVFPAYHPRKGEPTYFVEKFWESIRNEQNILSPQYQFMKDEKISDIMRWNHYQPKHHTIRAGNRWKEGDKFSPRVWSGKPYNSKQIIIAPDIEIVKVWSISKDLISKNFYINGIEQEADNLLELAKNDGLSLSDLLLWFQYPKPFVGQIICWNPNINY